MADGLSILDATLEAIRGAQERSRSAFFQATIAAAIIIVITFNWTLSWKNGFPRQLEKDASFSQQEIYKENLKQAFARETYTIPLLGVTVNVNDLPLLGPSILLVSSFYFAAASRAARSQIERLIPSVNPDEKNRVFESLQSQMVLNTDEVIQPSNSDSYLGRWGWTVSTHVYRMLIFLPFVAGMLCWLSEFRAIRQPEITNGASMVYETFTAFDWLREISFMVIGIFFNIIIISFAVSVTQNNRVVRDIVKGLKPS